MGTRIYFEKGKKRVFACAADWPGWCRSAANEGLAMVELAAYAQRYAPVVRAAGLTFDPKKECDFKVVETVEGNATTDFGALGTVPELDARTPSPAVRRRNADILRAAWTHFDHVVTTSPESLRKGPRGGGRNRTPIVEHVLNAEAAYARKVGRKVAAPAWDDSAAVDDFRDSLIEILVARPKPAQKWPLGYAARRITWHVLDHAWEIEDRSS